MSTSTRLILILTLVVGAVMGAAGYVLVQRQEAALMTQRRNEVIAHAITLQIALDSDYRAGRTEEARILIDRLSENPKIEGVVLYDEAGEVAMVSNPLDAVEAGRPAHAVRVIETGETLERIRTIGGREFFSVTMPLDLGGGKRGAFEIIEVMTFVKADIQQARLNIAMTTLLLFTTIFAVVFLVTRRSVSRPIRTLLGGARALGQGDLGHRVRVPSEKSEFAELAREFNRMADRLEDQRLSAAREAEERLVLEREMRHHERLALVGRLAADRRRARRPDRGVEPSRGRRGLHGESPARDAVPRHGGGRRATRRERGRAQVRAGARPCDVAHRDTVAGSPGRARRLVRKLPHSWRAVARAHLDVREQYTVRG